MEQNGTILFYFIYKHKISNVSLLYDIYDCFPGALGMCSYVCELGVAPL